MIKKNIIMMVISVLLIIGITVYSFVNGHDTFLDDNLAGPWIESLELKKDSLEYDIAMGRYDKVRTRIRENDNVNSIATGVTPLMIASTIEFDDEALKMCKLLIDNGADVNKIDKEGRNALFYASAVHYENGKPRLIKYLIDRGTNMYQVINNNEDEETNVTVPYYCVTEGNYDVVKLYIQNGYNINYKDSKGRSLLSGAYRSYKKDKNKQDKKQSKKFIKYLLENGAKK
ncbi:ankyrin repeat domain-containing protein [Hungatella hathewayi]|uniref:ankyrin repeat domain-containing protein n=1 Tax=Anaerostipes faecis TaxID=2880702 RepID=UPI000EBC49D9|nr:ankyrin repeat domain-containing protein [Anaerostipes faecis]RGC79730.1 ankyrin repeat domain-containing protein [Hungatella hathewayi]